MDTTSIQDLLARQSRSLAPDAKVVEDTSDFMRLDAGDVMVLENTAHLITRNEEEVGFGMDGDQKYWVKRTLNLHSGEVNIVKLVFFEEFTHTMGGVAVRFYRSPSKEAKVLDSVQGHVRFMQGFSVDDAAGNNVRVIDFIRGPSLNRQVVNLPFNHQQYFRKNLPVILERLCPCLEALSFLHQHGLVHGDVRWDHIFWDRERELYRWIDFDYTYDFPENPWGADLFGLGKIIGYVVGKGPLLYADIQRIPMFADAAASLVLEDFSVVEQGKLMNLKKLYPYIPESLNNVLLHFSGHAHFFYESVEEVLHDLHAALNDLKNMDGTLP